MARRGFTLVEMVLVALIMGILAAVATPTYTRMVERSQLQAGEALLLTIYSGERAYYLSHNFYQPLPSGSSQGTWRSIYMDNPNSSAFSPPVEYIVDNVSGSGSSAVFRAVVTRKRGSCINNTRTIDQTRALGGNWQTCPNAQ